MTKAHKFIFLIIIFIIAMASCAIADENLNIIFEPDKTSYDPGEKATIYYKIDDGNDYEIITWTWITKDNEDISSSWGYTSIEKEGYFEDRMPTQEPICYAVITAIDCEGNIYRYESNEIRVNCITVFLESINVSRKEPIHYGDEVSVTYEISGGYPPYTVESSWWVLSENLTIIENLAPLKSTSTRNTVNFTPRFGRSLGLQLKISDSKGFTIYDSCDGYLCSICNGTTKAISDYLLATSTSNGYVGSVSCVSCGKMFSPGNVISSSEVLVLPSGVKELLEESFNNIASKQIVIPNGCKVIGDKAFAGNDIYLVVIPESVTVIADNAFSSCRNAIVICAEGSYAEHWCRTHGFTYCYPS